jgi:hypothetical protein
MKNLRILVMSNCLGVMTFQTEAWARDLVNCPQVYKPATCSFKNFAASGDNSCLAFASLLAQLPAYGIDPSEITIDCQDSEILLRLKQPICGIAPTTTTCSVQVNDKLLTATAQNCDSPLPQLRYLLKEEGLTDTLGLKVECTRSQFDNETSYSVYL